MATSMATSMAMPVQWYELGAAGVPQLRTHDALDDATRQQLLAAHEQQLAAYGQQPTAYAQQPTAYGQQPTAYGQ